MYNPRLLAMAATAITTFSYVANAWENVNTNLVVYWGQGPNQQRLSHFCQDSTIDIIPIAFLNIFPDQAKGYPGTNFGNQCGVETYKNPADNTTSPLLSNCPLIGPDIITCQKAGKKILLSLGGSVPSDQSIGSDSSAITFAIFLWQAFGPIQDGYIGPRPFGDAVVDGFDFDIESILKADQDPADAYRGYGTMVNTFREVFALEPADSKRYYISASPQCLVPDQHLSLAIETSWFDFLFIQFYNTPQCSARAFFDHTFGAYGGPPTDISFDAWVEYVLTFSFNPDVKLYLGLPADKKAAYNPEHYLTRHEAKEILHHFQCKYPETFSGAMLYEATYSENNSLNGESYAQTIKKALLHCECAFKPSTPSASSGIPHATTSGRWNVSSTHHHGTGTGGHYATGTGRYHHPTGTGRVIASSGYPNAHYHHHHHEGWNATTNSHSGPTGTSASLKPYSTGTVPHSYYSSGTGYQPSGTGYYPSGTGYHPSGIGYYPSGTGYSPSGTGYPSTRGHSTQIPPYPYSFSTPHAASTGTINHPSGTAASLLSSATPAVYSSGIAPCLSSSATPAVISSGTAPFYSSSATTAVSSLGTAPYHSSSATPAVISSGTAPFYSSSATPAVSSLGTAPYHSSSATPAVISSGTAPFYSSSATPAVISSGTAPFYSSSATPAVSSLGTAPYHSSSATPAVISSGTAPYHSSSAAPAVISSGTATYHSSSATPAVISSGTAPYHSSSVTPAVHSSESVPATSTKIEASIRVPYQNTSCSDYPAGSQTAHSSATPAQISSSAYSTSDVESYTHTSATPVHVSTSSAYSASDVVSYTQTSTTSAHVSSSAQGQSTSDVVSHFSSSSQKDSTPVVVSQSPSETEHASITTVIVSSYITTCPVTKHITTGGSHAIITTLTVSTVYVTLTSTICTKCAHTATPTPKVTSVSPEVTSAPVTSASEKIHPVITTVVVRTIYTTCPVTFTATSGTKEIVQVSQTVSTIYETVTSTVCTHCVAPSIPTSAYTAPAEKATTQEVVTTVIVYSTVTTCSVTTTHTIGNSKSIEIGLTTSTIYQTITSTICTHCVPPAPYTTSIPASPVYSPYVSAVSSTTVSVSQKASTTPYVPPVVYSTVSVSQTASTTPYVPPVAYSTVSVSQKASTTPYVPPVAYSTVSVSQLTSTTPYVPPVIYSTVSASQEASTISTVPVTSHSTLYNTIYNTVQVSASKSSSLSPYLPDITVVSNVPTTTKVGVVTLTIVPVIDTTAAAISSSSQALIYSSVTVSLAATSTPKLIYNGTATIINSQRPSATASGTGAPLKTYEGAASQMSGMGIGFISILMGSVLASIIAALL